MNTPDDQRIFTCTAHLFTVVASRSKGEMSCRGTPGHRVDGCSECDRVVDDAMAECGMTA